VSVVVSVYFVIDSCPETYGYNFICGSKVGNKK